MADVKQEKDSASAAVLTVVIKAQDGTEVQFKIKKHTKMGKVFSAYAQKKAMDVKQLKFVFDGSRVSEDLTAEGVGLEDGDTIDAFVEQIGGALQRATCCRS